MRILSRRPRKRKSVPHELVSDVEDDGVHAGIEKRATAPFAQNVDDEEEVGLDEESHTARYQGIRERPQLFVERYRAIISGKGA